MRAGLAEGFHPSVQTEILEALGIKQGRIILNVSNPKHRQKETIYYVLITKLRFIIL